MLAFSDTDLDQASSELQIVSPAGELVDYTAGLYFYFLTQFTLYRNGYQQDFADIFTRCKTVSAHSRDDVTTG